MTLTLRAWLASRHVVPVAIVGLLAPALLLPIATSGLRLRLWVTQPAMPLLYAALVASATTLACTVALIPSAPTWESGRRGKVSVAHGLTWLTAAVAATTVAPALLVLAAPERIVAPSSIIAAHLAVAGLAGVLVPTLGAGPGVVTTLLVWMAVILAEQYSGIRYWYPDMSHEPHWAVCTALLVLGVVVQGATAGESRWVRVRRSTREDE